MIRKSYKQDMENSPSTTYTYNQAYRSSAELPKYPYFKFGDKFLWTPLLWAGGSIPYNPRQLIAQLGLRSSS